MQAFITEAQNRPGEFARHAEAIAKRGINVEPFCLGLGDRGGAAFLCHDEQGTRAALNDAGIGFREVPVLTISREDKPGAAAGIARQLANAGVNIQLFAPVDYGQGRKATVAIGVDKIEEARKVLSAQLTEWVVPAAVAV
jgi:hypothetical protein